jgi:DNA polymerase bacteriophage-type
MTEVHLDFETYSACPIRTAGSYRYARHPSTEVLIACYTLPGEDHPRTWLPWCEEPPDELVDLAADPDVVFWAHNAQFERGIWHYVLHLRQDLPDIPPERWRCTAALAASNGLGRSLDTALKQLGTGVAKDPEGARLIKVFCMPRKPTKKDPRTRIHPKDATPDFRKFITYCERDVLGEQELHNNLIPLHPREQQFFTLDMVMNERGLPIDLPLVHKAQKILGALEADIASRVQDITGGIRATQGAKLKEWFSTRGLDLDNLQAQTIRDVLAVAEDIPGDMRGLLALRIEAGKASTKKLLSMVMCTDPHDHVIQGSFLFHGAHTGRYAGRLVQPQNFIRGTLKWIQQALIFDLLHRHDADVFKLLFEWPIDAISQCMRGFIKASKGHRFVVVDYSAIEARVLAWVAGENKVLRAYREGVDVYKMMAASLFGITIEEVSSEQRRLAKNLVLGCGYSLGGARFVDYCANLGQEVDPAFAMRAVKKYRQEHPNIVASWKKVEDAVVEAIRNPGSVVKDLRCKFRMRKHWLCIQLPSGREIRYPRARAVPVERWGKPAFQISYETDYHGKITREGTYGGKLIENIVQGVARDVMREGTFAAEEAGYPVHGTVHDELITMRKIGEGSVHELEEVVCDLPDWTNGIPLGAEGFECERYRKG